MPARFTRWDSPAVNDGADAKYSDQLLRARQKSGEDESVITGAGLIRGRRVAIIVSEFSFLGGSIGHAAADRIVSAVERATRDRLPLLAGPASGGTRMQEGTLAFLSMVKITAAIRTHRKAGLPYLVYLRHPTTGGVMASWASLGHVTIAEPGALLGFLGPRVYEALYGSPFPENVQMAENLFARGLIDAVVPPDQLPAIVERALGILAQAPPTEVSRPASLDVRPSAADAWSSIEISRDPRRPSLRQLLSYGAQDVLPLSGTGQGEKDPGLLLAMARFGQASCIVLGHNRLSSPEIAMGPASLREARRGMLLAEELKLPLVTVIDTAGAALSKEAEEGGLAGEIARSLYDLIGLPHADRVRAARTGRRRRGTRPGPRRSHDRRAERLALAAAAGGGQRHRAPQHRVRPRDGGGAGRQRRGPVRQRHRRPHRGRETRMRPRNSARSAAGWGTRSNTSSRRCPRARWTTCSPREWRNTRSWGIRTARPVTGELCTFPRAGNHNNTQVSAKLSSDPCGRFMKFEKLS